MSGDLVPAGQFDEARILRALGIDASDVNAQALLLTCRRYGLDPLLRHMILIQRRPYITRDGYLHVAHASGQFDGLEVIAEGVDGEHWWAEVAVYRKDMAHPFRFRGRYPRNGQQKLYGPEMAIKCAEVMALRRAFDVSGMPAADEAWDSGGPEAVDVEGLRVNVRDRIAQLGSGDKADLRGYCSASGVPQTVGAMSVDQLEDVAGWLDDLDRLRDAVEDAADALPAELEAAHEAAVDHADLFGGER